MTDPNSKTQKTSFVKHPKFWVLTLLFVLCLCFAEWPRYFQESALPQWNENAELPDLPKGTQTSKTSIESTDDDLVEKAEKAQDVLLHVLKLLLAPGNERVEQ